MVQRVRDQAETNDKMVSVLSNYRHTMFGILLHVCFGKTFEVFVIKEFDVQLRRLVIILAPQLIDFIPFVQLFSKKHMNEAQELHRRLRDLFDPIIMEHRKLRKWDSH